MEKILKDIQTLKNSIENTINWIKTPNNVENINDIKNSIDVLKKNMRSVNRFEKAINRRTSVVMFGISQVGKSFLVENLIKKSNQIDSIVFGKEKRKINFLDDINPDGRGQESTGAATRFTIVDNVKYQDKPFELKLLSQAELAIIIMDSFYSDLKIDEKTINIYQISVEEVNNVFKAAEKHRQPEIQIGFTEDDVYEIRDYANKYFSTNIMIKSLEDANYWEKAIEIIPYLDYKQRTNIIGLVWNNIPFFNTLFNDFSEELNNIDFSKTIYAGEEILMPKNCISTDGTSFSNTIIDVESVRSFYNEYPNTRDGDIKPLKHVEIRTEDGKLKKIKKKAISVLLTEITFVIPKDIIDDNDRAFFKEVDILDFPGARSRDQMESGLLSDSKSESLSANINSTYVRGKVAYLFNKYSYELQSNSIIFCIGNELNNVKTIPHLITEWIENIHGRTTQERQNREKEIRMLLNSNGSVNANPLLVVLTKFNISLSSVAIDMNQPTNKYSIASLGALWNTRISTQFKSEYSGNLIDSRKWIEKWTDYETFKNLFWLRVPKYSISMYNNNEDGIEISLKDECFEAFSEMKKSFVDNGDVKRFFHNPEEAWEESTQPNKSGIDYIVKYLTPICNPMIKEQQIKNAIIDVVKNTIIEIKKYHESGNQEELLLEAELNAFDLSVAVASLQEGKEESERYFGVLLDSLSLDNDRIYNIYRNFMADPANRVNFKENGTNTHDKISIVDIYKRIQTLLPTVMEGDSYKTIIDKFKIQKPRLNEQQIIGILTKHNIIINDTVLNGDGNIDTKKSDHIADIYVVNIMKAWEKHIKNNKYIYYFEQKGLDMDSFELLTSEYIKTSKRVKLMEELSKNVREHIDRYDSTNNQNFELITSITSTILNNFTNTFGWSILNEDVRPLREHNSNGIEHIFTEYDVKKPDINHIQLQNDDINNICKEKLTDYVIGLRESIIANVTSGIKNKNIAENSKLGKIIDIFNSLL